MFTQERAEASLADAMIIAHKSVNSKKINHRPGHRPNPLDTLFDADTELRQIFYDE